MFSEVERGAVVGHLRNALLGMHKTVLSLGETDTYAEVDRHLREVSRLLRPLSNAPERFDF